MSRPVDVLEVLEATCGHLGGEPLEQLEHACAAVAELVEAAKAINVAIACGGHEERINRSNPLSVNTFRAALAKFGGAR